MHELHELKEMLCRELEDYGKKGELDIGSLEIVDKLAHAVKNLGKIIEMYEDEDGEYSGRYDGDMMSYARDGRRGRSYRGGSYARGRTGNVRRDAMGRYSRAADDIIGQLEDMMEDAPDERTRTEIQRLITKMQTK